jgi:parallel beta-helix repeat protein
MKKIVYGVTLLLLISTFQGLASHGSKEVTIGSEFSKILSTENMSGMGIPVKWIFNVYDWYQAVEVSFDNERIFCGGYNSGLLYCLQLENGQEIWRSDQVLGPIVAIDEAPNGKYLGVASEDGNVYLLNASNGYVLWNYTIQGGVMCSVVFSADSNFIYAGHASGTIVCLNIDGALIWEKSLYGQVYSLKSSKSGNFLIAGQGASSITSLNPLNGSINWNFHTDGTWSENKIRISFDDKLIVVASTDNNVYLLNATTGNKLWNYTLDGWVKSASISRDNTKVGAMSINAGVYCFNSANGRILWNTTFFGQEGYFMWPSMDTLEFSPSGRRIVIGGKNTVFILDVATGVALGQYFASGDICSMRISSDGRYVIIGTYYNGVHCIYSPWFVDDDGFSDFRTIQEAINVADSGDAIYVRSGTYYENIIVNKSVQLIGECKETTIIDGNYTGDVVLIVADNVTLSGFTIRNSQRSWAKRGVGLNGVKNCNLTENTIENNIFGIHLYSSYNNFLRNNNITNNEFNFVIDFSSLPVYVEQLINDIDSSNIIDGAPIYYWINKHNIEVPLDAGYVALINCTRVTARNLKLTKNGGFYVFFTSNSLISNNTFIGNIWGLLLLNSTDNEITTNNVTQNAASIGLVMSSNNTITQNNISYNGGSYAHTPGMYLESYIALLYSHNNTLSENNITNNTGGVYLDHANNNKLFHNNFMNNFVQVKCVDSNSVWDNDYPSGGNYWSDYTGVDVNNDGLGDTPYVIDENNIDRHPLVAPFRTFNVGAWNGTSYNVGMVTNSTVSSFQVDTDKKRISFNVSGVEGTIGFCRVAIPNIIAQDLWQGNYTVLLDGSPWPFINWTDNVNTYILINYTHSEHEVVIIPEFPSTLTLAIFMLITLIATTLWKTKRKR